MRLVGPGGAAAAPPPRELALRDAIEERELLRRAGRRDEAAVRILYRDHVARVHRCISRILGATDADVEDVVQQTFLAAIDGADRFDGRSSVATWLVGIATRRALDQSRDRWRRARWRKVTVAVGLGRPEAQPDHAHAQRGDAESALRVLDPNQRMVFVLHEVEGYTLAEIREMTGTGISTLHARLQAARKKLDALASAGTPAASRPPRSGSGDEGGR
jgi:RNA polymerase sigma-70 factor (ECF subfamily)